MDVLQLVCVCVCVRMCVQICRWPVSYSSHLGKRVANVLPWAVVWHLMGAVWMVSVVGECSL